MIVFVVFPEKNTNYNPNVWFSRLHLVQPQIRVELVFSFGKTDLTIIFARFKSFQKDVPLQR